MLFKCEHAFGLCKVAGNFKSLTITIYRRHLPMCLITLSEQYIYLSGACFLQTAKITIANYPCFCPGHQHNTLVEAVCRRIYYTSLTLASHARVTVLAYGNNVCRGCRFSWRPGRMTI